MLIGTVIVVLTGCSRPQGQPHAAPDGPGHVVSDTELTGLTAVLHAAAARARSITYASRNGVNDAVSHVTGSVFVPHGDAPPGGFPIVAVGHKSLGSDGQCAPSGSPDLLGDAATVAALLDAGYVVTVPDYQGLGKPEHPDDSDFHPYLDSSSAGYNMIDAVRAARNLVPASSTSWAAIGTQEGGQAAWAANELADNYGTGLKLTAAAALAPVTDLAGLADDAMDGTLTTGQKLMYVGYLNALKSEYFYDINLDDYRRGAARQHWDALLDCRDNAQREALAQSLTPDDLRPADARALHAVQRYLQKTTLPQGPTQAPMYVIYGGQDSVTPPAWTERALARACAMGDVIQIAYWPDKDRQSIEPLAALGWLNERMRAVPSANDCPAFLAAHGG